MENAFIPANVSGRIQNVADILVALKVYDLRLRSERSLASSCEAGQPYHLKSVRPWNKEKLRMSLETG